MRNNKKIHLIWDFVFLAFSLLQVASLAAATEKPIYVIAKKIYTCDKLGVLDNGGLLIEGRKIIRVDKKPKPPENAQLIDLKDKTIIPGLIDAHCSLGFQEEDFNIKTEPPAPLGILIPWRMELPPPPSPMPEARSQSAQAVYYGACIFRKTLSEGISSAKISIPTEYLVAGSSFFAKLASESPSEFILKNPVGQEFCFMSKDNVMERYGDLKKIFLDALEYEKSFRNYQKDLKAYLEKKKGKDQKEKGQARKEEKPGEELKESKEPKKDENQEIILQVLKGKIPAMIRASRINEIQAALKIAEEFKLNLMLVGGQEAYKIAEELSLKKIPVIAGPESIYVKKGEKINYIKVLLSKNVPVAFSSQSAAGSRFLPFQLAYAIQHGLTEFEALNILTIQAARVLGVADRVGSLEIGKDADFVVLSGEPFRLETRVNRLYVDGRLAYSEE